MHWHIVGVRCVLRTDFITLTSHASVIYDIMTVRHALLQLFMTSMNRLPFMVVPTFETTEAAASVAFTTVASVIVLRPDPFLGDSL